MMLVPGVQGFSKCKQVAGERGMKYFAVQNGGKECYVSNDGSPSGVGRYGKSSECSTMQLDPIEGGSVSLGGSFANYVYTISNAPIPEVSVNTPKRNPVAVEKSMVEASG